MPFAFIRQALFNDMSSGHVKAQAYYDSLNLGCGSPTGAMYRFLTAINVMDHDMRALTVTVTNELSGRWN